MSASALIGVFHHLSRWMDAQQKEISDLNVELTEKFLRNRKDLQCTEYTTQRGIHPIIQFLLDIGSLEKFEKSSPKDQLEQLIEKYSEYLTQEKCLCRSTTWQYCYRARRFLTKSIGCKLNFKKLNAKKIRNFILHEHRCFARSTVKRSVTSLRSFLKWLEFRGEIQSLHSAVPSASTWKSNIPKGISDQKVQLLLKSCDCRTHRGRRSHVLILLMARMGLRRGEIAEMSLDSIDWKRGEIVIKSKGSEGRLPLSVEVGKSLSNYIQKSRPKVKQRNIFFQLQAPYAPLSVHGITKDLKHACKRANIEPVTTHQFRHTVATRMLEKGSSLYEISRVLRHKSINSTAIYAKLDYLSLREVVRKWPGGEK